MPSHPFAAPIRAMAAPLQGAVREALLHAADELDRLPPADRRDPAALGQQPWEAVNLALQLERAAWQNGRLGHPWQNLASLRALTPARARRLAAAALAQWPAAAAAALARHQPLDPLRHALAQLLSLLQWQLQTLGEDPLPDLLEFDALLRRNLGNRDHGDGDGDGWELAQLGTRNVEPTGPAFIDDGDSLGVPPPLPRRRGTARGTRSAPTATAPGAAPVEPTTPAASAAPASTAARGASTTTAPAQFHFVLQGEHAQGRRMREHTEADLHFRYEAPPADALATVQHDAIEAARVQDLDLALHLSPCGAVTLVGARHATVQLRGGQLAAPVVFRLRALAAPPATGEHDERDEHGVHVQFVVRGETVHQQMLAIDVQPARPRSRGAAPPAAAATAPLPSAAVSLLASAAAASPPPRHSVRLSLSVDGDSLRMELDHHVDGELVWASDATSQAYDAAGVAALALGARGHLGDAYSQQVALWRRFDGTLAEGDPKEGLEYALWCAATAGAALNEALRQDRGIAELLDYVEAKVPDGAVLTITTDRVFLPWELLTPQKWGKRWTAGQRAKQPLQPMLFWGARFAIETTPRRVPLGERALAHLRSAPRRVSVNVNPDISVQELDDARQPQPLHQQWAARLAQASALDGQLNATCDPMREVLQNAQHQASLIYLYCHGQSAQPFGGSDERLVLDEGCPLAPGDLSGDADYAGAPIVFLNACDSGTPSPLAFASFLREFCQRGAIGLIATTNAVPITFAAHFGPQLVDRYLHCEGPLAEMLRQLRREHLARGNPVPLFYTLQCKLKFPRAAAAAAPSSTGAPP